VSDNKVQIQSPKTGEWLLIDLNIGDIVDRSPEKYDGVDVAKPKEKKLTKEELQEYLANTLKPVIDIKKKINRKVESG